MCVAITLQYHLLIVEFWIFQVISTHIFINKLETIFLFILRRKLLTVTIPDFTLCSKLSRLVWREGHTSTCLYITMDVNSSLIHKVFRFFSLSLSLDYKIYSFFCKMHFAQNCILGEIFLAKICIFCVFLAFSSYRYCCRILEQKIGFMN